MVLGFAQHRGVDAADRLEVAADHDRLYLALDDRCKRLRGAGDAAEADLAGAANPVVGTHRHQHGIES
jgi:hypothetical protein